MSASSDNTKSTPEDVRAAYNASVAVITNLGTVRFSIAALFVAAQIVLFGALGQGNPSKLLVAFQPFIPLLGLTINLAMVIFELRNNMLAEATHKTARCLEELLNVGGNPTPFLENKKLDGPVTHWLALQIVYGSFFVVWALLTAQSVLSNSLVGVGLVLVAIAFAAVICLQSRRRG